MELSFKVYQFLVIFLSALSEEQLRILGGTEASRNEYPYQVGIISSDSTNPNEENGFCGGSLISKNAVITAAHCVDT
jgi:secreted trypsin-like serine protease